MSNIYEIKNLRYAYPQQHVLNVENLTIAENKVTAIVGANGAGKSTLFDILAMLQQADCTEFLFQGKKLEDRPMAEVRKQIGYIQQKPYLMDMSVRNNIGLGLKFRHTHSNKIEQAVDNIAEELQLQSLLERSARQLSGGEVQKVALARALVLKPAVIIMDEPFTYLDEHTKAEMEDWIVKQKANAERTIIISMHDRLKALSVSDLVLSVINGDIYTASSSNMFQGYVDDAKSLFISNKLTFEVPEHIKAGHTLFIDPCHLVISKERLPSSMRNNFAGEIVSMNSIRDEIHIKVQGEATFNVVITRKSLQEMGLQPGQQIWVSCKSSQINVI